MNIYKHVFKLLRKQAHLFNYAICNPGFEKMNYNYKYKKVKLVLHCSTDEKFTKKKLKIDIKKENSFENIKNNFFCMKNIFNYKKY